MEHKITGIVHEPLLQVFIDVRKVYDSRDMHVYSMGVCPGT